MSSLKRTKLHRKWSSVIGKLPEAADGAAAERLIRVEFHDYPLPVLTTVRIAVGAEPIEYYKSSAKVLILRGINTQRGRGRRRKALRSNLNWKKGSKRNPRGKFLVRVTGLLMFDSSPFFHGAFRRDTNWEIRPRAKDGVLPLREKLAAPMAIRIGRIWTSKPKPVEVPGWVSGEVLY